MSIYCQLRFVHMTVLLLGTVNVLNVKHYIHSRSAFYKMLFVLLTNVVMRQKWFFLPQPFSYLIYSRISG